MKYLLLYIIVAVVSFFIGHYSFRKPVENKNIARVVNDREIEVEAIVAGSKDKIDTIRLASKTKILRMFDSVYVTDTVYVKDDSDSVKVTVGQIKEAVICSEKVRADSLILMADSIAFDSIKKVDVTEKACSLKEQAIGFGAGTVFGIILRSIF